MILLPVEMEIVSAQERSGRYDDDANNAADTSEEFGIIHQAWKSTLKENGTIADVDCLVDGEAVVTAKLIVHLQAHLPNHSTVPKNCITRYPATGVDTPRDGIEYATLSLHRRWFVDDTNNEVIDKELEDDQKMDKLHVTLNSKAPND